MSVLNMGTNTVARSNVTVQYVYRDKPVTIKHGDEFPSLLDWKKEGRAEFNFVVTGEYDFKPNKKVPPTIDTSKFLLSQEYLGTNPFVVDTTEVSEDCKTIKCVVTDVDTLYYLGEWGCDWLLYNGIVPTPTETEKPMFNVTYNLKGCILDIGELSYKKGETIFINLKSNEGTEFIDIPTMTMNGVTTDFNVHTKKVSCDWTGTCTGEMVVNALSKKLITYHAIKEDLTNIISDNVDTELEEGTEKTITYNVKSDTYRIDSLTSNIGTVTISEDKKTATVTFVANEPISIVGVAKEYPIIQITGTFTNCTCNYSGGEEYSLEKPIIISADSGYQFLGEFYFAYKQWGVTEEGTFINEGVRLYYDEDLSNTQFIKLNDNYNATLKPVEPVEPVSQFTNLYLTNKDELTLLSKERYQSIEGKTVDFGDYITNLYNTPFKVPSNIIGGESDIILGSFKTSVTSSLLISSKFIIDMGTIEVTEKYNNVYDYSNVMYVLHLPYFDKIYLDSEYVVNQSIKIEYVFDIYTGSATVNIYSSFIDSIIESRTNIIVSQIPFIQKQTNAVIGNITTVNKNNIVSPFIEVVRNIPYNVNTIFGGETIEYGVIGDYQGFTRCENVLLNSRATNTEKEEIIKLLNEGVIL